MPTIFTPIKDATRDGATVNLIGLIISYQEPRKSRGKDFVQEITIQDDFSSGMVGGSSTINCRLFKPSLDKFPKISGTKDIAILRKVKLSVWRERVDCCSTSHDPKSGALVLYDKCIPIPELSQSYQLGNTQIKHDATWGMDDPTTQEQMAAIHMKHAASAVAHQVQQHAATVSIAPRSADRLSLIKDLALYSFYDVRAEVVNIYYTNFGTVELKVTDYTPNESLFYYADPEKDEDYMITEKGWKGPYGFLVLQVILHESNAAWARLNVSVGDFIFLQNMRAKLSLFSKLEGVVHQDKQNPNQVDIRKISKQSEIDEIKKRKADYENKRGNKSAFQALQNEPKKSSAKASASRKEKKRQMQREQKEAEQRELEEKAKAWEAERNGLNTNVRAAFPEMKLSTLSEIIYNPHLTVRTPRYNDYKLPFVNSRHRARVRVVDFYPPELELFSRSTVDPQWAKSSKKQDSKNGQAKERWEWGFVLLLEDANVRSDTVTEKLRVVVGNNAGQGLLNQNAVDLKKNPRVLKQIEEKLFLLWGNLLEIKTDLRLRGNGLPLPPGDNRLKNLPFDCCIEEYGHEVPIVDSNPEGYQRMYHLAQTFIQP